jgi:8-oxo-dGTP pyrophosphatase MutT (NUDIX family)
VDARRAADGGVRAGPADADLRATIRAHMAAFTRALAPPDASLRRAAVAVCVLARAGAAHVLLVKRANRGTNAGQWAFPGGRLEPGEDAVSAALRELEEEVGLAEPRDAVAGRLDDLLTDSGFCITPVVVLVERGGRLRRNPAEIHSLHPIALPRLLADGVPRWAATPDGRPLLQMPVRHDMVIHAPTGAILWQFRDVALRGVERRVAGLEQPAFAAR